MNYLASIFIGLVFSGCSLKASDLDWAKKIETELFVHFSSDKSPPDLKISNTVSGANFVPLSKFSSTGKNDFINIHKKVFDICRSFGADSSAALAFIIGHELSHHFQIHRKNSKYKHFDFVGNDKSCHGSKITEGEADVIGGFYAYLSGYNTLGLSEQLLTKMYIEFELENSPKYPTLEDRILIHKKVNQRLGEIIDLFDAGTIWISQGEYIPAISCFEYLCRDSVFPTEEMFNNLGVCYGSLANQIIEHPRDYIQYPFLFDGETFANVQGSQKKKSSRSLFSRSLFFYKAQLAFNRAVEINGNYEVAKFNLYAVKRARNETFDSISLQGKLEVYKNHIDDIEEFKKEGLLWDNKVADSRFDRNLQLAKAISGDSLLISLESISHPQKIEPIELKEVFPVKSEMDKVGNGLFRAVSNEYSYIIYDDPFVKAEVYYCFLDKEEHPITKSLVYIELLSSLTRVYKFLPESGATRVEKDGVIVLTGNTYKEY